MNLKDQYDQEGYAILERVIAPEKVIFLKSKITLSQQKGKPKSKTNLMGDSEIVSCIDALIRPLFLGLNIGIDKLVELNALLAGNGKSVRLSWHQDRCGEGIHSFQLPLLPGDRFHQLIPGTHRRELSEEEVTARNAGGNAMPGAIEIALNVGDVLLRSPLIVHRGYNEKGIDRITIVGTYSRTA